MARKPVYSVTSAKEARSDDLLSREIRYGIAMGIRTLCFVGAVVVWRMGGGWWAWLLLAGALVLPYTSVILANAGVRRRATGADLLANPPVPDLPATVRPSGESPAAQTSLPASTRPSPKHSVQGVPPSPDRS